MVLLDWCQSVISVIVEQCADSALASGGQGRRTTSACSTACGSQLELSPCKVKYIERKRTKGRHASRLPLKASPKWRFPFISAVLLCLCLVSPLVRRGPSPQGSLCEDCLLQLVAVCCGAAGLLFRQPELLQGLRVLPGDGERIRRPGQSGRDGVRLPGRLLHPCLLQSKPGVSVVCCHSKTSSARVLDHNPSTPSLL